MQTAALFGRPGESMGSACDDSSVCTLTDVCENGVCQSNLTLPCDDQNVCTDDICDPTTGCDNQIILECVQPVPAASDHGRILLVMGMVSADSAPNSGGGGYSPSVGCLRRNTTIAMASNSATINI